MGLYIANDEWRRVMSGATVALVSTTDQVQIFMGNKAPEAADAGVILDTTRGLKNWDVSTFGGSMWIKGKGIVYTLVDPAANEPPSDQTDSTPAEPPVEDKPTTSDTFNFGEGAVEISCGTYDDSKGGITVAVRAILPEGIALIDEADNNRFLHTTFNPDGGVVLRGGENFRTQLYEFRVDGPTLTPDPDGFYNILMHLNNAAERIEFYVNGVAYDPANLWFDNTQFENSGDFRGGREHIFLRAAGRGQIAQMRYYQGAFTGSSEPAATPDCEVRAAPDGKFASPLGGAYDVFDKGVKR